MNPLHGLPGIVIWCAGVACAALIAATVDPAAYTGGRARDDEERLQRNSSAIAAMLGEFRTSMSDIMFIKTERYLHGGVAYRPHHDEAVPSAGDLAAEVDEHQAHLTMHDHGPHDHDRQVEHAGGEHCLHHAHHHIDPETGAFECGYEGAPTLIPTADRDFRGFIGHLHRQIKPWRDPDKPHLHTDGRELTPWFRLMTTTDPRYVRGYVAGAFWLQAIDKDAALAFVKEGLGHNPDAFQLLVSRGLLLIREARLLGDITADPLDPPVRAILERARADFRYAAELALEQRPAAVLETGEVWQPGWGPYLEDDAARACQMTVVLTQILGDPERARTLAERYIRHFPDYAPLLDTLH